MTRTILAAGPVQHDRSRIIAERRIPNKPVNQTSDKLSNRSGRG
jgi:hypothetical protein